MIVMRIGGGEELNVGEEKRRRGEGREKKVKTEE